MAIVPTVTIWDPRRGAVDINASDYDPAEHELYEGQADAEEPEPPTTFDPSEVDEPALRVEQTSESPEWWKVLDADDEQVGKAHRTEEGAHQALRELIEGEPE